MNGKENLKANLRKKSTGSANVANTLLEDEYAVLMKATRTNLEALRPMITDQETFDALLPVVEEATAGNMDLAKLEGRIKSLGAGAMEIAKTVAKFL